MSACFLMATYSAVELDAMRQKASINERRRSFAEFTSKLSHWQPSDKQGAACYK